MGASYLAIAYGRFYEGFSAIGEHIFVLAFWILNTGLVMMLVRNLLIRMHLRLVFIPTVVIPAFSFFFLYFIYICAIIGNLTWGETPTLMTMLMFIPHLFELADNFSIPRGLVVALVAVPWTGFFLIYAGRIREMILWHWVLKESYNQ